MAEYGIPGTGTGRYRERVDMLNVRTGEVFEIKPISQMNTLVAQEQASRYLGYLRNADGYGWLISEYGGGTQSLMEGIPSFNWNRSSPSNWSGDWSGSFASPWRLGVHFPSREPVGVTVDRRYIAYAGRGREGEVFYWFEENEYEYDEIRQINARMRALRQNTFETTSWVREQGFLPLRELWLQGEVSFDGFQVSPAIHHDPYGNIPMEMSPAEVTNPESIVYPGELCPDAFPESWSSTGNGQIYGDPSWEWYSNLSDIPLYYDNLEPLH